MHTSASHVAGQVDLIGGTITRIRQLTKVDSSLLDCLLDLRIEAKGAGYSPEAFRKAMQRLSSNAYGSREGDVYHKLAGWGEHYEEVVF